jgi:hypothetical protein
MYDSRIDASDTLVGGALRSEPIGNALVASHSSKHGASQRSIVFTDVSVSGDSHMMSADETTTPPEEAPLPEKTHKFLSGE